MVVIIDYLSEFRRSMDVWRRVWLVDVMLPSLVVQSCECEGCSKLMVKTLSSILTLDT
jgi:hypothetical protein